MWWYGVDTADSKHMAQIEIESSLLAIMQFEFGRKKETKKKKKTNRNSHSSSCGTQSREKRAAGADTQLYSHLI